ncbi:MAG: LamG-like jellyroll fold domain-containing protein [Cytophagales bacterium]|nr:LamG-like jellyroll fold domain-containing protein [Cytophagales bacterium]
MDFFLHSPRVKRLLQVICVLWTLPLLSYAQIDKEFWFAAPDLSESHGHEPIHLRITAFQNPATVTISMPSQPLFTPITVTVAAGATHTVVLTSRRPFLETPFDAGGPVTAKNTGVHIVSNEPIAAYYEPGPNHNVDIFSLKGKNALGKEFYVPLIKNVWNHQPLSIPGRSGFIVVATEDNTTVNITPTETLEGGRAANATFTVTLNKGQTYAGTIAGPTSGSSSGASIMPAGTKITSNKPIAVTMFHDSINTSAGGCYDLAGDQLVPVNILGTKYIIVRTFLGSSPTTNPERVVIMATKTGTTTVTVTNTSTATYSLSGPGAFQVISLVHADLYTSIVSDKPIYVVHFGGFGCETGAAVVPPIECTGSKRAQFVRSTDEFLGMIIITKSGCASNFTLNGIPMSATFSSVPGLSGWVAARIDNIPTSTIAAGAVGIVQNNSCLFHLGIINGSETGGTRYGYFSNFNSINLGDDINVSFGASITLDGGPDGDSYQWFLLPNTTTPIGTGQTLTLPIYSVGTYVLKKDIGGCILQDSICIGTLEYVWKGSKDTNINDADNWSAPCGFSGVPNCNNDIIIPPLAQRVGSHWPMIPTNATFSCRDIKLLNTGVLNMAPSSTFNVCRHFFHEGNLNANPSAKVRFIGTVPQHYERVSTTALGEFPNVELNNTTPSLSINTDPFLRILDGTNRGNLIVQDGSQFTFVNGHVRTQGTRELVIKNRAPNAVQGHSEAAQCYVAGRLRRYVNATGSYDFPVGLVKGTQTLTPDNTKQGTLQGNGGNLPTWQTANYSTGIGTTKVLDFNPTHQQYVKLPSTVAIAGNAPRTVEMWARIRNFSGDGGLFSLGTPAAGDLKDFALRVNNGNSTTFNFRVQLWGSDIDANSVPYALHNTWAHYAVTYDGNTVKFYINGVLVASEARTLGTLITSNAFNYLGRWWNHYFDGQIDEVRIWNVARTQMEIATWKDQLIDRCNPPAGLVAYYDFEEGSGSVINHYNATCPVNKQYQLANVNFTTASNVDNLLAYFNEHTVVPTLGGLPNMCSANFNCQMLNHGYWTINAYNTSGNQVTTSGNYQMTLYNRHYTNFGITCGSGTTVSTTIVRRANSSAPWLPHGGVCLNDHPNNTSVGGMSGFSDFGTAQSPMNALLPAELIEFSAQKVANQVWLKWQTASEINFDRFAIEKSYDGENFFTIAEVPGKGSQGGRYSYLDSEPRRLNYYRLRLIDRDDTFEYSRIISVNLEELGQELRAYPNPAAVGEGFFLTQSSEDISRIMVYNLLGQLVYEGTPQGTSSQDVYVPFHAQPGVYLVKVLMPSGSTATLKLTVK